jgi:hypothetical protein
VTKEACTVTEILIEKRQIAGVVLHIMHSAVSEGLLHLHGACLRNMCSQTDLVVYRLSLVHTHLPTTLLGRASPGSSSALSDVSTDVAVVAAMTNVFTGAPSVRSMCRRQSFVCAGNSVRMQIYERYTCELHLLRTYVHADAFMR